MNEAKEIKLTNGDLTILIEAMNDYYSRMVKKAQKGPQPRPESTVRRLAKQQELLQRLSRYRYEWQQIY